MKLVTAIVLLLSAVAGSRGQGLLSPNSQVRSLSGQFVVFQTPSTAMRPALRGATNSDWVTLEPTLVTISAERIKQAVWRELGVTGPWQNQVAITLQPTFFIDQPVKIIPDCSMGVWNYRVALPDQITRERYLHAMVQTILEELANRQNRKPQAVEIPAWLVEGMTRQLLANQGPDLVLNTPRLKMNGVNFNPAVTTDFRPISPLEKAHKTLVGETPLTFEELCWPAPGQIEGSDGPRYRACAQVFTYNLLRLPGGKDCMREFIAALPFYLNWQMAFLQGFKPHFSRPLDVEKWWALQSTGFASRDLIQTWTFEESWNKLAATLVTPVDVFRNTNEMPVRADIKLQKIVSDWESAKQEPVLRGKIEELGALRLRVAPELAGIAAEYIQALETYMNQRDVTPVRGQRSPQPSTKMIRGQRTVIQQLNLLDLRLARLQPNSLASSTSSAKSR